MSETKLVREIQLDLGKRLGLRMFRNNVGVLQDKNGQHITYGLCKGSSDLIGWKSLTITPEMIGRRVAVFCALEVKADKGHTTPEQKMFISVLGQDGGFAAVVRSISDARQVLNIIPEGTTLP